MGINMKKSFFEKIANWINGSLEKDINQKEVSQHTEHKKKTAESATISANNVPGQNSIEKQDNLINAIVSILQANYRGEQRTMEDKVLSVFILDSIFYDSIRSTDFKANLESAIFDELGLAFNRIDIKGCPLPSDMDTTELFSDVYIGVETIRKVKAIRKAVILPVKNNGSTVKTEYYLDSEEIATLPNCRYNIGASEYPITGDNGHRENYIAIDDNPNSEEYDKNKYVSRAHANISFSEKYGFLLNVEYGGTRAAQKRTYIYRENEKIELDNPLVPIPLKNNDYIVLSKYVHLLFKEM